MNLLPFLLGTTIIFWGWQTGLWLVAIPLAIAYELARYLDWRWDLTTADFRQTSHVCTVLLVGVLIYLLISDRSLGLIFSFFQWLPLICAPLLLAQTYSTSDRVDLNALLFFKDKPQQKQLFLLDLTYPYFAVCILAASAANNRGIIFYICAIALISIVLRSIRSPRFSAWLFLVLLFVATFLGTIGHIGLHQLQLSLQRNTYKLFYGLYRPHRDPNQVSTAIGDLGSVKQSNKIVLRVKPAPGEIVPQLLRRAAYNKYASGLWLASKPEFTPVTPGIEETSWLLSQNTSDRPRQITVSEALAEGDTLLKLPDGSSRVSNLPVAKIQQNQYGTVQIFSDANWLTYQVQYDPKQADNRPPTAEDLKVIAAEKPALEQIATQLELTSKTPQQVLETVRKFFSSEFDYSLELTRRRNNKTPLSEFLLDHRAGHCEYFATATALLLREVGIPTRYVVGYSVNERSKLENQYIVRSRNAHAWTLVYLNGRWQAFDTTPASWIAFENRQQSSWQQLADIFSWLAFQFSQFGLVFQNLGKTKYLWLLTIPVGVIIIREFTGKGQRRSLTAQRIRSKTEITIGADSEIYQIEAELNKLGLQRGAAETWHHWLIRLQTEPQTADLAQHLAPIVKLHYRYRFDPQGISDREREQLRSACQLYLEQLTSYREKLEKQGTRQ